MARARTAMHKIRRIIEYYTVNGMSIRQISLLTRISRPTVAQYLVNFQEAKVDIATFKAMSDTDALAIMTVGKRQSDPKMVAAQGFYPYMAVELKKVGVTRQILWAEYRIKHPDGFTYSPFCHHFRVWQGTQSEGLSMHQEHRAGESVYLDWAGKLPLCITNPDTGEKTFPQVFVAILGASSYTYAEACPSQKQHHWTAACQHALEYFEGVPEALVPDAYKGAITTASKHEALPNRTFQDFADHYGTVILPARPYRPKDKALVEGMVRILYTRLFAPLRNQVFHSLDELNEALWQLLELHNHQKLQRMDVSRHDLWMTIDKPALKALPAVAYEYRQYKLQKVPNTYHIRISENDHYYSVPWQLYGKEVTIIYSGRTVEVYHNNVRQAFHRRSHGHGWTTNHDHMPDHHRFIASWSPQRITSWAASIGPSVAQVCGQIMDRFKYPEHGYRTCMGIIKLPDTWGKDRVERACMLALNRGVIGYRAVKTILECNEDKLVIMDNKTQPHTTEHENLRGQTAYS